MIIDLNEKAPHVDVKLGNKTYQVFANDKNTQVLDDFVSLYTGYQGKATELAKRFEATEDGSDDVKPLSPEEYKQFATELANDLKETVTKSFDKLLGEDGVGERLWKLQNESTEHLEQLLGQIQDALTGEQKKYEQKKADQFKQAYPTHQAQNRAERRSKKQNKNQK